jgi:PAT family beta-lactamase induction signal transducer AmpG
MISAGFMVLGGMLSDHFGRRRTLAVYIALMSLPVLYLMMALQQHGWIIPVSPSDPNRRVPAAALVTALWVATLAYAVVQGLMYGTRSAIFMDVTNPAVAATQFTAYMALLNLSIAYSAAWQGIAIEALGYPATMLIDAAFGLACLALMPWMRSVRGNAPDGGAPVRARASASILALACILWLPYRMGQTALGAAAPVFETLFTVVFVASALFLLASAAVLAGSTRALVRLGAWLSPLLLLMYARHGVGAMAAWLGDADRTRAFAQMAETVILAVPLLAAALLIALALQPWRELEPATG